MPNGNIQSLPEAAAIKRIVETVQKAKAGSAPFALVLGSGFSHGLVPTARELVEDALPLWMKCNGEAEHFDQLRKGPLDQRISEARTFWRTFVAENGIDLALSPSTGLPEDYSAAYRAAFNSQYFGAVGAPADARDFQRALMRLDAPRLNAAHFLLASLIGVQPGRQRRNDLFKAKSAFCRLILTTNFDPFLQIALQSVNRLYLISDTPELGVSDEILDDQIDAIHLVYVHGSIHRRSQATSDEEIAALKAKNARMLKPVLERHGVVVLGYSGWDDAIVEALAACDRFDHRLYWCGREADPLSKGSFGPRVAKILQKPTATYVRVGSAGHFMGVLCSQLVGGLPRLLSNPIGQLREMLQTIDLSELKPVESADAPKFTEPQPISKDVRPEIFARAQAEVIQKLMEAEKSFLKSPEPYPSQTRSLPENVSANSNTGDEAVLLEENLRELQSAAELAVALEDYSESLQIYSRIVELLRVPDERLSTALLGRALGFYFSGEFDKAVEDWTRVIDLPNVSLPQLAKALYNRGIVYGQKGETAKELSDYTRIIEDLPNVPPEQMAKALYNRALTWVQAGEPQKAFADYNRLIEHLPDAPVEQIAMALYNRGFARHQNGEKDQALDDFTRLIDHLPNAPVEQVARALYIRGVILARKGPIEEGIKDLTRIVEGLPGAPVEQVATALAARGWLRYEEQRFEDFLRDMEAAVQERPSHAAVAFGYALALLANGRDNEALEAYKQAATQFPGDVEEVGLTDLVGGGFKKDWLSQERADPIIQALRSRLPPKSVSTAFP